MKVWVGIGLFATLIAAHAQESPKVYLSSTSTGNTWAAFRDQSHEMAKDFARDCPDMQITTNPQSAEYEVRLNHIEVGLFVRDNQLSVMDMFGNVLSTKETGSIKNGVKRVCALILADAADQAGVRRKLVNGLNGSFQKNGVLGYAEISGDRITVHSERASLMRLHMVLASGEFSMVRRAGITMFIYTNDANQNFVYDVKADQIVSPATQQAAQASK